MTSSERPADTAWHASPALMERYSRGDVSDAAAYSVEAHLVSCADCRELIAGQVEPTRVDAVWHGILDELDAPRPGLVERFLLRLRVPDHMARLLAATPSLRLSWLLALVATLTFAVAAAHIGPGDGALFLVVAPLLPVAGVAAAYGRAFDPAAAVSTATPAAGVHLVAVRSAAVLTTTVGLSLIAAAALPAGGVVAWGWLLPGLGLSLATLAAATVVDATRAAIALSGAWIAGTGLSVWSAMGGGSALADAARDALAYRPAGQVGFLALTLAATAVLVARRDAFALETIR